MSSSHSYGKSVCRCEEFLAKCPSHARPKGLWATLERPIMLALILVGMVATALRHHVGAEAL